MSLIRVALCAFIALASSAATVSSQAQGFCLGSAADDSYLEKGWARRQQASELVRPQDRPVAHHKLVECCECNNRAGELFRGERFDRLPARPGKYITD